MACLLGMQAYRSIGTRPGDGLSSPEGQAWADLADQHTPKETTYRVRVDLLRAQAAFLNGRAGEAWQIFGQTYQLAESLGDPDALVLAATPFLASTALPVTAFSDTLEVADRLAQGSFSHLSSREAGGLFMLLVEVYLSWSKLEQAEVFRKRLRDLAEVTKDSRVQLLVLGEEAVQCTWEGRLTEAIECGETARELALRSGLEGVANALPSRIDRRAQVYLGQYEQALAKMPELTDISVGAEVYHAQRAYLLAFVGRADESRAILMDFLARSKTSGSFLNLTTLRALLECQQKLERA